MCVTKTKELHDVSFKRMFINSYPQSCRSQFSSFIAKIKSVTPTFLLSRSLSSLKPWFSPCICSSSDSVFFSFPFKISLSLMTAWASCENTETKEKFKYLKEKIKPTRTKYSRAGCQTSSRDQWKPDWGCPANNTD